MSDQGEHQSPPPASDQEDSSMRRSRSPRDRSPAQENDRASPRRASQSRSPLRKDPDEVDPEAMNPGNNIYVANLAHRISQPELDELFSKFGRLHKCEVILDPMTKESRGFGFVTFEDTRDAEDAVNELNGKEVHGRRIRVEHAKRSRGHDKTPGKYLGPRLASIKYGRDRNGDRNGPRDRSRDRDRDRGRHRSRSRSRDRGHNRRYDDRERYDRRYDDRERRGGYDRERNFDGRRSSRR